ncbi:DUF4312 family protein [Aliivibrio fischeri]|uniref:DUF4312 family protein n=1 Tax=Aliivibrio fischeri TaxID=668 RepID=UPI001F15A954|nr:DUF4312 family protein [Aliivibrio fischeri]MCE7537714.1 DUF4312 family protein [Aliivibrio fischeri]MCE7560247.1 DUF4312 family protein [Aliivibrio fischeri]
MKESITTTVTVSGNGNTKQSAFSSALSNIQKTILKDNEQVILRIEPVDVKLINAEKKERIEKFMFFFLPRNKTTYSVTIDVTVNVTVINIGQLDFKSI